MASTSTPYGLKAVNLIGGRPFAGSTRQIKIASGYGTNIFNGSVVAIVAGGTIEKITDGSVIFKKDGETFKYEQGED